MVVEDLNDEIEDIGEDGLADALAVDEDTEAHELHKGRNQNVHALVYEQGRVSTIYMAKVKEISLLSYAEELELGKELEIARNKHKEVKNKISKIKNQLDICPQSSLEEDGDKRQNLRKSLERLLSQEIQAGSCFISARNALVDRNLRLVVHYVSHYLNRGVSFLDLVQEGNIGLIRATEKFEWRYGYRFSTYASWWIKQGIRRSISQDGRTIHIPAYVYELLPRIIELQANFFKNNDCKPTLDELAELSGYTKSRVEHAISCAHATLSILSLDAPLKDQPDMSLGDTICDPNPSAYEVVLAKELEDLISKEMETLPERQRDILGQRHSLGIYRGEAPKTLQGIASDHHLSRERVRQIEREAHDDIKKRFGAILREYWFP